MRAQLLRVCTSRFHLNQYTYVSIYKYKFITTLRLLQYFKAAGGNHCSVWISTGVVAWLVWYAWSLPRHYHTTPCVTQWMYTFQSFVASILTFVESRNFHILPWPKTRGHKREIIGEIKHLICCQEMEIGCLNVAALCTLTWGPIWSMLLARAWFLNRNLHGDIGKFINVLRHHILHRLACRTRLRI